MASNGDDEQVEEGAGDHRGKKRKSLDNEGSKLRRASPILSNDNGASVKSLDSKSEAMLSDMQQGADGGDDKRQRKELDSDWVGESVFKNGNSLPVEGRKIVEQQVLEFSEDGKPVKESEKGAAIYAGQQEKVNDGDVEGEGKGDKETNLTVDGSRSRNISDRDTRIKSKEEQRDGRGEDMKKGKDANSGRDVSKVEKSVIGREKEKSSRNDSKDRKEGRKDEYRMEAREGRSWREERKSEKDERKDDREGRRDDKKEIDRMVVRKDERKEVERKDERREERRETERRDDLRDDKKHVERRDGRNNDRKEVRKKDDEKRDDRRDSERGDDRKVVERKDGRNESERRDEKNEADRRTDRREDRKEIERRHDKKEIERRHEKETERREDRREDRKDNGRRDDKKERERKDDNRGERRDDKKENERGNDVKGERRDDRRDTRNDSERKDVRERVGERKESERKDERKENERRDERREEKRDMERKDVRERVDKDERKENERRDERREEKRDMERKDGRERVDERKESERKEERNERKEIERRDERRDEKRDVERRDDRKDERKEIGRREIRKEGERRDDRKDARKDTERKDDRKESERNDDRKERARKDDRKETERNDDRKERERKDDRKESERNDDRKERERKDDRKESERNDDRKERERKDDRKETERNDDQKEREKKSERKEIGRTDERCAGRSDGERGGEKESESKDERRDGAKRDDRKVGRGEERRDDVGRDEKKDEKVTAGGGGVQKRERDGGKKEGAVDRPSDVKGILQEGAEQKVEVAANEEKEAMVDKEVTAKEKNAGFTEKKAGEERRDEARSTKEPKESVKRKDDKSQATEKKSAKDDRSQAVENRSAKEKPKGSKSDKVDGHTVDGGSKSTAAKKRKGGSDEVEKKSKRVAAADPKKSRGTSAVDTKKGTVKDKTSSAKEKKRSRSRSPKRSRNHRKSKSPGRRSRRKTRSLSPLLDPRYKRFGGGTSGLGGYSPRRARPGGGNRTPSPPRRSPETKDKHRKNWDSVPHGIDTSYMAVMQQAAALNPALAMGGSMGGGLASLQGGGLASLQGGGLASLQGGGLASLQSGGLAGLQGSMGMLQSGFGGILGASMGGGLAQAAYGGVMGVGPGMGGPLAMNSTNLAAVNPMAAAQAAVAAINASSASTQPGLNSMMSSLIPALPPPAVTLSQSTRPARRLYIGNAPATVSDGELLEFINAAMLSANANYIPGTKPCINCTVNIDKGYAFAEFITVEDASAALAFDGISLHGTTLKIRRPKDYAATSGGAANGSGDVPLIDMVSSTVRDGPQKIFIGNLPGWIPSDKVKEIVTAFGQLKAFHWELDLSRRPATAFAFIQYMDSHIAIKAVPGLNGIKLGNNMITVVLSHPDLAEEAPIGSVPSYTIPEHAKILMAVPTRVMEICNLITPDQLVGIGEEDLEEFMEDVRTECSRFGNVKSMHLVMPSDVTVETCDPKSGISAVRDQILAGEHDLGKPDSNASAKVYDIEVEDDETSAVELPGGDQAETEALPKGPEDEHTDTAAEAKANEGVPIEVEEMVNEQVKEGMEDTNANDKTAKAMSGDEPLKPVEEGIATASDPENVKPEAKEEDDGENSNLVLPGLLTPKQEPPEDASLEDVKVKIEPREVDLKEDVVLKQGDDRVVVPPGGTVLVKDVESFRVGRVYVEFSREASAQKAAHSLQGRRYDGRKVATGYVPLRLYQKKFGKGIEAKTVEEKQALALSVQEHLTRHIKD